MKKLSILIADDHSLMRMGLRSMIGYQPDMQVIGEAANGEEAVALAAELKPDIVIMDLMMPVTSGMEATRLICAAQPETKVIILTSFGASADLVKAVTNGAVGAQAKESPTEELLAAIRTVANGGKAIAPDLQRMIDAESDAPELTERQRNILSAAIKGLSNKEIAKALNISPVSVKKHLSVVFSKIGASNRAEAAGIAMRRHLIRD